MINKTPTIYTTMAAHFEKSKENIVDLMNHIDVENAYDVNLSKSIILEYKDQLEEIELLEKIFIALEKDAKFLLENTKHE